MENFLPALLIIGGVIYKIYSEYQKEQEKARRRIPQTPPPVVVEQRPRPTAIKPTISSPIPVIPKVEHSGDILEDAKIARERRMAAAKSNKTTVAPLLLDTVEEREGKVSSFDLREAVIQSAILERPYQ